jgi:hypothetical protein
MLVEGDEPAAFAADVCVTGHPLGEVSVEADQGLIGLVAAQQRELPADAVHRVEARAGFRAALAVQTAEHAHGDPAVAALVIEQPLFLRRARLKNARAEDVGADDVVVAALAEGGELVVGLLAGQQGHGDERRIDVVPLALSAGLEDGFSQVGGQAGDAVGLVMAHIAEDRGQVV